MEKEAYGYDFELGRGQNYYVNEVAKMFGISSRHEEPKKGESRTMLNTSTLAEKIIGWRA